MFIPIKDIKPNIKLVELTLQIRSFSLISRTATIITKSQLLRKDVDFYLQFIQLVDYEDFEFSWDHTGYYVHEIK